MRDRDKPIVIMQDRAIRQYMLQNDLFLDEDQLEKVSADVSKKLQEVLDIEKIISAAVKETQPYPPLTIDEMVIGRIYEIRKMKELKKILHGRKVKCVSDIRSNGGRVTFEFVGDPPRLYNKEIVLFPEQVKEVQNDQVSE